MLNRPSLLDRLNPLTRITMAAIITVPLVLTLDWLSATVMLVLILTGALSVGFSPATLLKRLAPLLVMAVVAALSMALYGKPGGHTWWAWGLILITDQSLTLAGAVFVRLLSLGLSAVLLFGGIDPTDLADGLAQRWRLPSRFVLGSLAGVRLTSLFADDWRTLVLARRARGLGDTGRLRRFATMAFALLVMAIRRGSKLATAMEARGFGGSGERTWARESKLTRADAEGIAVSVIMVAVSIAAALWFGTWRWVVA